jgi:hypothetical protein
MSGNTEIRKLTNEVRRRREQTELLNKRVHRLKEEGKKQISAEAQDKEESEQPPKT